MAPAALVKRNLPAPRQRPKNAEGSDSKSNSSAARKVAAPLPGALHAERVEKEVHPHPDSCPSSHAHLHARKAPATFHLKFIRAKSLAPHRNNRNRGMKTPADGHLN